MTLYASKTSVNSERSKAEIERTLARYGATEFIYGTREGQSVVGFRMNNRIVRFTLPLPTREQFQTTHRGRKRRETAINPHLEQAIRQRWRALALAIKAKLEAVDSGITEFEQEFLAHFVLPDGRTVGEHTIPRIRQAYETGKVPQLLTYGGPGKEAEK